MKRIGIIADTHCGHEYGLTPPGWSKERYLNIHRPFWDWYQQKAKEVGKLDVLVCNGDMVDGRGTRSGGVEELEVRRDHQIQMAEECIDVFDAEKVIITTGTAYHTGQEEDWEGVLARQIGAEFYDQFVLEVNPFEEWLSSPRSRMYFDFKHHVGGSSIPHGRATAVLRAKLWESIKALRDGSQRPNVVVRSHVHYHIMTDDADGVALTTPCLQLSSRFGNRKCDGVIHIGFIIFEVSANVETGMAELTCKKYPLEVDLMPKPVVGV